MLYKSFEEMPVWKDTRKFVVSIYQISKKFKNDFSLIDQIRRAVVSVLLNLAEGFERKNKKELMNFVSIARGSAGEVRAALYVAYDLGYLTKAEFDGLFLESKNISKQLNGLLTYFLKTE